MCYTLHSYILNRSTSRRHLQLQVVKVEVEVYLLRHLLGSKTCSLSAKVVVKS